MLDSTAPSAAAESTLVRLSTRSARFWRHARDMHDFMIGRARRQADRVAKAVATAAHVTVRAAAHRLDRDERRAIDRPHPGVAGLTRQGPGILVDAEMHRGKLGQQAEDAVDRAEKAAPDQFVAAIKIADDDRAKSRSAENEQRRLWILIDADHLAVDLGQGKRNEGPAFPGDPARDRMTPAEPACRLGQRALRTEEPAPGAADQKHAEEDERPPDTPEGELREEREIVPDMREPSGQRQECGHGDKHKINENDRPLAALNQAPVAAQAFPERGK